MTTRQAILLPVDITSLQPCNCAPAYKDRGRIDDQCWYHRAVEVVEILTEGAKVIELTEDYKLIDLDTALEICADAGYECR